MQIVCVSYYRRNAPKNNNYRESVLPISPKTVRPGGIRISVIAGVTIAALAVAGRVWASGEPPDAVDDRIEVLRGQTATVLVTGESSVLANDFDPEGDNLIAFLTRNPRRGTVTFRLDGTFIYTHNGGNRDSDQFRYVAFDGTGFSSEARVRISIVDEFNNPPIVTGNPGNEQAVAGEFYSLDLSAYFTDPDPDDELEYSASGLPGGNRLRIDDDTGVLSGIPNSSDVRDEP